MSKTFEYKYMLVAVFVHNEVSGYLKVISQSVKSHLKLGGE
jgi:hypothetical protein